MTDSLILAAIDSESYEYLTAAAPHLLDAIEHEMARGLNAEGVKRLIRRHVGPEREALALRCYQAARFVERRQG